MKSANRNHFTGAMGILTMVVIHLTIIYLLKIYNKTKTLCDCIQYSQKRK